jgi:hypothetical protein
VCDDAPDMFQIYSQDDQKYGLAGISLTAVCVAIIGVLASVDVLRHKPLATLRAE